MSVDVPDCFWMMVMRGELLMGFKDVTFLASRASFPPHFNEIVEKVRASGPPHVL